MKNQEKNKFIATRDLGCIDSIDVINQFVSLNDKFVMDVGCGGLQFAIPLIEQGASVLAVDPDPIQAKLNRDMDLVQGLEFKESGAEDLPAKDGSVDGIFFSYSLHHIPAEIYPAVFKEVHRVLRSDGFLCVIEPTPCPLNEVMKLFHDEDKEREFAQNALIEFAIPMFHFADTVTYHSFRQYDSFDHFADHFSNRSFNSLYSADDVRKDEVRLAFERHGKPDLRFQSPKTMTFLRELR